MKIFSWAILLPLFTLLCAAIFLRCLAPEKLPAGWSSPPRHVGEKFTSRQGLKACLWGVLVILLWVCVSVIFCINQNDSLTLQEVLRAWLHKDAIHYRKLAEFGYRNYTEDGQHLFLVFFPLYPWVVHLVNIVLQNYDLCGPLVSAFCFLWSCYILARLVTEEFGWETAMTTLMFLSAYPFSFFYCAYYTESLFLALSVTTFYFLRKHHYALAGIFGAFASLTRMQGIFLLPVAFVEYFFSDRPIQKIREHKGKSVCRDIFRKILPSSLMLLGTGLYLAMNYAVDGNPFQFSLYQKEHWFQHFTPLPQCITIILQEIGRNGGDPTLVNIWLPDLVVFLFSLAVILAAVRLLDPAWSAYFLICILLNFSISWPLSCGRYMSTAFPLFLTLSIMTEKKPFLKYSVITIFLLFQGIFLTSYLERGAVY